jgi:hypothetical protein
LFLLEEGDLLGRKEGFAPGNPPPDVSAKTYDAAKNKRTTRHAAATFEQLEKWMGTK